MKIFSTVGDLLRNRFSLRTINKFNSTVKKYKWSCSNVSGLVAVHIMPGADPIVVVFFRCVSTFIGKQFVCINMRMC